MRNRIVEVDRDADRRYNFAMRKAKMMKAMGKAIPPSTRETVRVKVKNEGANQAKLKEVLGDQPLGEEVEFLFPKQLKEQLDTTRAYLDAQVAEKGMSKDEADKQMAKKAEEYIEEYDKTLAEIDMEVEMSKAYFSANPSADKYKSTADVLKALRAELAEFPNKFKDKLPADDKKQLAAKFAALAEKLPAFDEEQLAELEEVPVRADASKDSWGSADVLYKSEAVDAFNMRYLLGVFDTKEEAEKAFEEWNAEYVKSREDMKAEMDQWSKQEEARLEADTSGRDRIMKILEEARR